MLKFKQGGYPVLNVQLDNEAAKAYVPTNLGDITVIPQHDAAVGEVVACLVPGADAIVTGVTQAAINKASSSGKKLYAIEAATNRGKITSTATSNHFLGYGLNIDALAAAEEVDILVMANPTLT